MTIKTLTAADIFSYLRGAVRGSFGLESFEKRKIAIIGLSVIGQELLTMLCLDDTEVFFYDESITNYAAAHKICPSVKTLSHLETVDIVINLVDAKLSIVHGSKFKTLTLPKNKGNLYEQGIHDFYQ